MPAPPATVSRWPPAPTTLSVLRSMATRTKPVVKSTAPARSGGVAAPPAAASTPLPLGADLPNTSDAIGARHRSGAGGRRRRAAPASGKAGAIRERRNRPHTWPSPHPKHNETWPSQRHMFGRARPDTSPTSGGGRDNPSTKPSSEVNSSWASPNGIPSTLPPFPFDPHAKNVLAEHVLHDMTYKSHPKLVCKGMPDCLYGTSLRIYIQWQWAMGSNNQTLHELTLERLFHGCCCPTSEAAMGLRATTKQHMNAVVWLGHTRAIGSALLQDIGVSYSSHVGLRSKWRSTLRNAEQADVAT